MITDKLIAGCIREEPKAQYELYRTLYPMLMSICTRYEKDRQDAKARVNEGYLKILNNMRSRKPEVPFTLWARRIMINTVVDQFRADRMRRLHERSLAPLEEHASVEVNEYLRDMETEAFAAMLTQVPPMSRSVFNLFAIDGYSHAEIATLLGISEGTSKWHVSNARSVLQRAIAAVARRTAAQTASR